MSRPRKCDRFVAAHVAPPAAQAPTLLDEIPLVIRLEREVADEFREPMRKRFLEKIEDADSAMSGSAPVCEKCQSSRRMKSRGRKKTSFITLLSDNKDIITN